MTPGVCQVFFILIGGFFTWNIQNYW